jgi:hypothetical protein
LLVVNSVVKFRIPQKIPFIASYLFRLGLACVVLPTSTSTMADEAYDPQVAPPTSHAAFELGMHLPEHFGLTGDDADSFADGDDYDSEDDDEYCEQSTGALQSAVTVDLRAEGVLVLQIGYLAWVGARSLPRSASAPVQ